MQKFETIKNHRGNQRNQKKQRGESRQKLSTTIEKTTTHQQTKTFRPMSTLADMGLKVLVSLISFGLLDGLDSFCLDLFGCFGFFGFPDGFDIFKCTLDSSKRLGRGSAPLLNKAFTLHEFPYIRGFLV